MKKEVIVCDVCGCILSSSEMNLDDRKDICRSCLEGEPSIIYAKKELDHH